ncbi:MAG: SDR family NAD(P)-dependent oxidoreductase [Gammaproteobacteria bacterium]
MNLRFDGRVALVTGAGKGLGRAYAQWLAARGARVVVNNRRRPEVPSSAQAVVEAIRAAGGVAVADEHAVEHPDSGRAMVQTALDAFGRIDIVVCNAAISPRRVPLEEVPLDLMREVIDINLFGTIYPVQAALPHMIRADYGRIVLTSSASGLHGQKDLALYGASKTALIGLARCVAIENRGRNIRINIISPYARTEMAKAIDPRLSGFLAPEKVAPVVGWLCSERCDRSGIILGSGAGRVRKNTLVESPVAHMQGEDITDLWPTLERLDGLNVPSSSAASSIAMMPEILVPDSVAPKA